MKKSIFSHFFTHPFVCTSFSSILGPVRGWYFALCWNNSYFWYYIVKFRGGLVGQGDNFWRPWCLMFMTMLRLSDETVASIPFRPPSSTRSSRKVWWWADRRLIKLNATDDRASWTWRWELLSSIYIGWKWYESKVPRHCDDDDLWRTIMFKGANREFKPEIRRKFKNCDVRHERKLYTQTWWIIYPRC